MTITPSEQNLKKVKVTFTSDPVETSFEKWAKPGHFSRVLSKGPNTTTWIWNLHADAHDFDSHTTDLEDISRKIFSAHFGQLAIIEIWLSGMFFHGARFSNYESWLADPVHVKPGAQVVWSVVGQEILNGDLGGNFQGVQITSGLFQVWRAAGMCETFNLDVYPKNFIILKYVKFYSVQSIDVIAMSYSPRILK